ncbi:polysaccharide deacetylase family protein [Desulfosporosinus sp. I2]|uniref:polysaccharide deacetylase family protein n=1 Tax=Desulfosporosinus sp. I2 TaxID=1617025 RepID=UPI001FA7B8CA|nr:polysaccharide deacetylase family protein [Desulfosporosinus sp. I2]
MKLKGCLIFMACFLGFSVFWVGVFPYWSIATQSVIPLQNSPAPNQASVISSNRTVLLDQTGVIDSNEAPSTTVKESGTLTSPSSQLFDQGEYPVKAPLSQAEEGNPQSSTGETLSPSEYPSGTFPQQPVQSKLKPNIIISGTDKEDLFPTPLPGPAGTPIHPYYDEAGNPPTAPSLAMRQRKFQPEHEKMAYLTFDDGPYPSTTPKILAILAKENVRATFFDIGQQVELYPDLLKAEYEQDNAIGNHTYSHKMAEVYKGPKDFLADVKKAEEIIYQTIGLRPQIVRAPGGTVGHFNINYFNTMDAEGYLMEDWNVDSGDTDARLVPADQLIQHVEQQIQGKTRVVILLHDLVGKNTTVDALPGIIELLKKQGFSFGVLGPHVLPIVFPAGLHS